MPRQQRVVNQLIAISSSTGTTGNHWRGWMTGDRRFPPLSVPEVGSDSRCDGRTCQHGTAPLFSPCMQDVSIKTWAWERVKISKGMLNYTLKSYSKEMQKDSINLSQKHLVLEGKPKQEWLNWQTKDLSLCIYEWQYWSRTRKSLSHNGEGATSAGSIAVNNCSEVQFSNDYHQDRFKEEKSIGGSRSKVLFVTLLIMICLIPY